MKSVFVLFLMCVALLPALAQYVADPGEANWPGAKVFPATAFCHGAGRIVADPAARGGKAVAALIGQGRASHIVSGGWLPVKTDAKYDIAFRLRFDVHVSAPSDLRLPIYLGTEDKAASSRMGWPLRLEAVYRPTPDDAAHECVLHWRFARLDDLKQAATYHDYVISVERPPVGVLGFRAYWYGRAFASTWVDQIAMRETPLPTEAEQLRGLPEPDFTIHHGAPRTLVVNGVYGWTYQTPELVGGACELTWRFPTDAKALLPYDAILLVDVNLGDLTLAQRLLLATFVKRGGGLVLLGGPYAYGKSAVHASPLLQELLPVETAGLWDIAKAPGRGLTVTSNSARLRRLAWDVEPRVYYYHRATPKPGAETVLTGGRDGQSPVPLLVTRDCGNGMVAAFLFTPFGMPDAGEVPLWRWQDWGTLLNFALNTVRGIHDTHVDPQLYTAPKVVVAPRAPAPGPRDRTTPTVPDGVAIMQVHPDKLCVRPGDDVTGAVWLGNGTRAPVKARLVVTEIASLDKRTRRLDTTVTLPANARKDVAFTWSTGDKDEFGREVRAELYDRKGTLLDAKSDDYTIGWNNYRVGQCRLVRPWTWDKGVKTFPEITPEDRWNVWLPEVRNAYATTTEYFFWAPDDFGNLVPDKDQWFAGQSTYLISQADVHAVIDAAHAQGIAAVTYGKKWMSVSGLQGGHDGVELVREHPEWCEWDVSGHPKWWFDADKYTWSFDQWRDYISTKGKQGIGGVAVNCAPADCVRFGIDQLVKSAQKYGWDGVRFDDHFTLDSVFDGGLGLDGQPDERGGDYEAMTAENNRLTRELTRAANPHFLVGFNYGGTYTFWGVRQPDAYAESCRDDQFVMIEHSFWWGGMTWPAMISLLAQENHRVAALGGVPGLVAINADSHAAHRWETAVNYASQGHYYNVRNCPEVVQYSKFMLRYGELLYGRGVRFIEDAGVTVTPDNVVFKPFVHERTLSPTRKQLVVSLINDPGNGKISAMKAAPAPVKNVAVSVRPPAGWKVARAWRLNPDDPQFPCTPITITPGALTVPELACWNVLVVELAKQ